MVNNYVMYTQFLQNTIKELLKVEHHNSRQPIPRFTRQRIFQNMISTNIIRKCKQNKENQSFSSEMYIIHDTEINVDDKVNSRR